MTSTLAPRLAVAASPLCLARRVGALLDLPVLETPGQPSAPGASESPRVVVVATASTARSLVADRYLASLGSRLAAVVCWRVGAVALENLLGHLLTIGVPGFVGVPERAELDELCAAPDDSHTVARATEDLAVAAYLAAIERRLEEHRPARSLKK